MIAFESNKPAKALIMGMGKTGFSCANFLASQGIEFSAVDSRKEPPMLRGFQEKYKDIDMTLGGFEVAQLSQIDMLVVSPGISLETGLIKQAVAENKDIVGDIELFARYANAPIIAITGSNGKSTVTSLLFEMIKRSGYKVAMGGNIGIPALDLLEGDVPDYYVLEISSFQLDLVKKLPTVASVVLNVSVDHMDRYSSFDAYVNSKLKIYEYAQQIVVNKDDKRIVDEVKNRNGIMFTSSFPEASEFGLLENDGELCLVFGDKLLMTSSQLKVVGLHNYCNVLAGMALGHAIGLPHDKMVEAAQNFKGLSHRCELLFDEKGVKWFNDSKATNVAAAVASITSMEFPVVLIAGGVAKDKDFDLLISAVSDKVKAVILMGQDAAMIEQVLNGCKPVTRVDSMYQAVLAAKQIAQEGDCVLLAPACASFDMYENYEKRGEEFRDSVALVSKE